MGAATFGGAAGTWDSSTVIVVPGYGPANADVMLVGEAPGKDEARVGRPFVGRSGIELNWYLSRFHLNSAQFYLTNVVKLYQDNNPDPTPQQIDDWTGVLLNEIATVRPKVIIPVGRFAARWFLGDSADMDSVRGIPHRGGEFDATRADRAMGAVIVPSYHPAFGLRQADAKVVIHHDLGRAANIIRLVQGGRLDLVRFPNDPYAGREHYSDVTGAELARLLRHHKPEHVGYDTEGDPDNPWSLQVSWEPGTGYMLRKSQPDLHRGVEALQELADRGCLFAVHDAGTPRGTGYDTQVSRACGLELQDANFSNTMYRAFALRTEPKGLKPLLWRWCGMRQDDYWGMVEEIGRQKQIKFLGEVARRGDVDMDKILKLALWHQMQISVGFGITMYPAVERILHEVRPWPQVPARVKSENNGTLKVKKFGKLESRAKGILADIANDKRNKDGNPVDPRKRWMQIEPELRGLATAELGWLPFGTLDDVNLDRAVHYGCLSGPSLVETENGPRKIEDLVKSRYDGCVWSVDREGRRALSRVIGWYRYTESREASDIAWMSIQTEASRFGRWGQLAARYTPDHRLLTARGWRRIDEIDQSDHIATGVDSLSTAQWQLVLGSTLGDGSLSRRNDGGWVQFRMSHSEPQLDYLRWKAAMVWGSPEVALAVSGGCVTVNGRSVTRSNHYSCAASSHPQLIQLRESAYGPVRDEIVIGDWVDELHELGLAIWYQDDGTLVSGRYARIYTLAINKTGVDRLKEMLLRRFGIVAGSYVDSGQEYTHGGHIITIGAESCDNFYGLIAPFVHPCMRYKLPLKHRDAGFIGNPLQLHRGQFYAKVERVYANPIPGKRGGRKTSYCIDVENAHNFITGSGEVAHNCRDSDGTLRLDIQLTEECKRMEVEGVCWTGNRVLPIFEEMQQNGMPASRKSFVDLAATLNRDMQEIQAGLSAVYFDGRPFNPAPNTKDVETLVRRLGITGLKTTKKSGKMSTSMKALEYLGNKYPAISQVGEWRRRQKVVNTYCLPAIEMADRQLVQVEREAREIERSPDLFIVTYKIKPVSVETRRIATEDLSLLNQPVRTEIGRKVRACYMTTVEDDQEDPNVEVFGGWDFQSQEVRVAAHVTNDALLCSIMRDPNRKIHMETASRVFGKPISEIHEVNEKIPAKTAFFGMLYGLQGPGLLDLFRSFGLENWPLDACERLIAEIFKIYPGLLKTIREVEKETRRTGMVRDLYGHIRYLPAIWSAKRGEANEASRQAFSLVVQGTAQGMTQNAMVSLRQPLRALRSLGVKWALQVHDEIMLRFPRWLHGTLNGIMSEHMENRYGGPGGLRLRVPVLVDGHMAVRWDRLK